MKFGFASYFVLAGALAAAATPGFAQTQPQTSDEAEDQGAGDIVVTAQRREQSLADVPVSVSVVSGEKLAQTGLTSMGDLAQRLPSVKIAVASGANILAIRGVSVGNNAGFEQAVGTFVDGVYRGRSRAIAAGLFDVERVEVLKGPQPTFFGANVTAGAFNITSRKPVLSEASLNTSGLWSPSDDQYISEIGINAPLGDTLAIRLAGRLYGMSGFIKNTAINKDSPRNRDGVGRISLLFKPSENFTSNLRFDIGRNRDRGPATELLECPLRPEYVAAIAAVVTGPPLSLATTVCQRAITKAAGRTPPQTVNATLDGIGFDKYGFYNYDFKEIAWNNEVQLGSVTLNSITSYFKHKVDSVLPPPLDVTIVAGTDTTVTPHLYEKVNQFTQELRLTSDTGGMFEYMAGVYYARENLTNESFSGLYTTPAIGAAAGSPLLHVSQWVFSNIVTNNYSAFGSLSIKPAEGLTLDLGARYASIKKRINRFVQYGTIPQTVTLSTRENFTALPAATQALVFPVAGGVPGNYADPQRTDNKFTPSVKLSYKLGGDTLIYAGWARGFKAGGYSTVATADPFDPETADSYEAGIKASLLDRKLFLTATLFYSDYKNLQEGAVLTLPSGATQSVVRNAGKSRSKGFELSADAKLGDHVRFRTDLTYLDAKYIDFPNAPCTVLAGLQARAAVNTGPCIGGKQNLAGVVRAFAPKWSGNVGVSFSYPVNDSLKVTFDPQLYFTSRYLQAFTVGDTLYTQPGYAKFDTRIGVGAQDGKWEFAVIGKNLTNKLTTAWQAAVPPATGTSFGVADPHRSIAFQFSAKF